MTFKCDHKGVISYCPLEELDRLLFEFEMPRWCHSNAGWVRYTIKRRFLFDTIYRQEECLEVVRCLQEQELEI